MDGFQTESTRQLNEEAMAARIRQDITAGADGTDICCGVIGEVGCTWPLTGKFTLSYIFTFQRCAATEPMVLINIC